MFPLWGSQHLTPLLHPITLQVIYDQPTKTAGAGLLFLHLIIKTTLHLKRFLGRFGDHYLLLQIGIFLEKQHLLQKIVKL